MTVLSAAFTTPFSVTALPVNMAATVAGDIEQAPDDAGSVGTAWAAAVPQ
jgi:hypothetical protein